MSSQVNERWQVVDKSSWGDDVVVSATVTADEASSESEVDSDEEFANQILSMSLDELGWRMEKGLLSKSELLPKKLDEK